MLTKVNDVIFQCLWCQLPIQIRNVLFFLSCTCAPYFENSSATNTYRLPVKQNVSHMDENITALRVQISFKFAGHPCGDIQDIGLYS